MNLPPEPDQLARLRLPALRALWAAHFPRATPPAQKCLLLRELAWRMQERARGGLDAPTRRLLARATSANSPSRAPAAPAFDTAALSPGTRLVRTWRRARHEVHVLPDGAFRYRDQTFTNLSAIARLITGAHWSGPRFFGLAPHPRKLPHPRK